MRDVIFMFAAAIVGVAVGYGVGSHENWKIIKVEEVYAYRANLHTGEVQVCSVGGCRSIAPPTD